MNKFLIAFAFTLIASTGAAMAQCDVNKPGYNCGYLPDGTDPYANNQNNNGAMGGIPGNDTDQTANQPSREDLQEAFLNIISKDVEWAFDHGLLSGQRFIVHDCITELTQKGAVTHCPVPGKNPTTNRVEFNFNPIQGQAQEDGCSTPEVQNESQSGYTDLNGACTVFGNNVVKTLRIYH